MMRFVAQSDLLYRLPLQIPVYAFWGFLALPAIALATAVVQRIRGTRPSRQTGIFALAGLAVVVAASLADLLKPLFGRSHINEFFAQPPRFAFAFFNGDFGATFPSGHAAMGLAYLVVLWQFYPRWRGACAVLALLLLSCLVAARDHFLSDVFGGAMLGIATGRGCLRVFTGSTLGASVPLR